MRDYIKVGEATFKDQAASVKLLFKAVAEIQERLDAALRPIDENCLTAQVTGMKEIYKFPSPGTVIPLTKAEAEGKPVSDLVSSLRNLREGVEKILAGIGLGETSKPVKKAPESKYKFLVAGQIANMASVDVIVNGQTGIQAGIIHDVNLLQSERWTMKGLYELDGSLLIKLDNPFYVQEKEQ